MLFFFFNIKLRFKNSIFYILFANFFQLLHTYVIRIKTSFRCNSRYFKNLNLFFSSYGFVINSIFLSIEHIKIQELTFLAEYFLITAFFSLSVFGLFSLKPSLNKKSFLLQFQYDNQLHFLVLLSLVFYLVLVYQQIDLAELNLLSFNDSIINDFLAIISKLIIGFSSICYLIFITRYIKSQKLVNFEYYIVLFTAIFGFFLLCCTNDFITTYLAIELQGLAFYVLASFKKSSNFSIESGVKYFILGSFSTAFLLLGITFVYGFTGSLLLTDFHDFFLWIFSINSFFVSFETLSEIFVNSSMNNYIMENFLITKLNLISDNLDLFKKITYFEKFEFNYFTKNINCVDEMSLSKDISNKMFEIYYNLVFTDYYLIQKSPFELNYLKSLLVIFLVSLNFQNFLVELLYDIPEDLLADKDFIHLRDDLLQTNYYENIEAEYLNLQNNSLNYLNFENLFQGDPYFFNAYPLVECCYLSDCIFQMVLFAENLKVQGEVSNEITYDLSELFLAISDESVSSVDNFKLYLYLELTSLFNFQAYMVSVLSIVSLTNFFLQYINMEFPTDSVVFDCNFVTFGMVIIFLALLFKLALAPFHLWCPDVYEGSPTSSTFFFIVLSKLGIFVFLLRICYLSFSSLISYWQFYSILVATSSIFIGSVVGLKQRKLKSLLTYSSINNMGFVLLAFSVGSFEGIQIKFYYIIIYILTSLCLWAIILNFKKNLNSEKQNRDLGDLALLQESNSVIAQNLAVILFSMAGLPPMVGFLAKVGVFKALAGVSIYFFSVLNILFTVVATFYYLRIVKILFFENLLVGSLYSTINSKKVFIINILNFLICFFFISPAFLYLYSYKITLFLNKGFY